MPVASKRQAQPRVYAFDPADPRAYEEHWWGGGGPLAEDEATWLAEQADCAPSASMSVIPMASQRPPGCTIDKPVVSGSGDGVLRCCDLDCLMLTERGLRTGCA